MNKNQVLPKKDRKQMVQQQRSVRFWKNNFLSENIEKALKEIDEMVEKSNRGKKIKKL